MSDLARPVSTAALELVKLTPLMNRTSGSRDVVIGLIDGPVAVTHPDFNADNIRVLNGTSPYSCAQPSSAACMHGTFVAGILAAKRGSSAPAIAPNCTLLVRPIFGEIAQDGGQILRCTPDELATAIIETIDAGARVLNLSAVLTGASLPVARRLEQALDDAARRRVLVVAASGNDGTISSSVITRHPWVLPVIACDRLGRPTPGSNLSGSVGRRGLSAPGQQVTSLGSDGQSRTLEGTSAAAPFVTAAIALLWSELPGVAAPEMKRAMTHARKAQRRTITAPLLNAWASYQVLAAA